jgi:hypothetical protein
MQVLKNECAKFCVDLGLFNGVIRCTGFWVKNEGICYVSDSVGLESVINNEAELCASTVATRRAGLGPKYSADYTGACRLQPCETREQEQGQGTRGWMPGQDLNYEHAYVRNMSIARKSYTCCSYRQGLWSYSTRQYTNIGSEGTEVTTCLSEAQCDDIGGDNNANVI